MRTSSFFPASPPTTPSTAATSMPFNPPEFGTVTPFTFLIMLPLQSTFMDSGIQPSTSLTLAAAYAIAIGSVQPSAGINSLERISR